MAWKVGMRMPSKGRAKLKRAWSEKVASEKETSRVDSMLMSERAAETRRRSMTVPPPPSKGRRVTTSLSFRTVRPCWAIVARRGAAAPREALGALCADCTISNYSTNQELN